MNKHSTIGIDLVAMSANDLVTFPGMKPFLFMDYLAVQEKAQAHAGEIIKGIVTGLKQCTAVQFGKGETASVDELMDATRPGYGFDLAGCMIGFMPKKPLPVMKEGWSIVALASSGLHSNGYTTARHILLNGDFESREQYKKHYQGKHSLHDVFNGTTIGKTLLEPTRIYVPQITKLTVPFLGVNNTGYGLKNLNRMGNFTFNMTAPLPILPIFNLIQKEGKLSMKEAFLMIAGQNQDTTNNVPFKSIACSMIKR